MIKDKYHQPVLKEEVLKIIEEIKSNDKRIIDSTLGTAGHTVEFLKKGWRVLGIEADKKMLEIATKRLLVFSSKNFVLINNNFRYIDEIAKDNNFSGCDAVIFDLGVSNLQLMSSVRGFSFSNPDADLDMRIDTKDQEIKASDLLNLLRKDQLEEMFLKVLDKNPARKLSEEVLSFRKKKKFEKVSDFLQVSRFLNTKKSLSKSTLPFLALRISVNSELENLSEALPKAFKVLKKEGRLLVISFHSGEDRIVKNFFKDAKEKGLAKTFEVIMPGKDEITMNTKSRSAKLRFLEKL